MQAQKQNDLTLPKRALFVDTVNLPVTGGAVCYDHDYAGSTDDLTEIGRRCRVERPSLGNIQHFAGIIMGGQQLRTAPSQGIDIGLISPHYRTRGVNVHAGRYNLAAGDILGITPESYSLHRGAVFGGPYFRVLRATDLSAAAGLVTVEQLPPGLLTPFDLGDKIVEWNEQAHLGVNWSATADSAQWLRTVTATGTPVTAPMDAGGQGGWIRQLNGTADNDLVNLQLNGESFTLAAGKPLMMEFDIQTVAIATTDFVLGLATSTTAALSGANPNANDMIAFGQPAGDSSQLLNYLVRGAGTGAFVSTGVTIANATAINCKMFYDGISAIKVWVNNALIATVTANIPTGAMSPFVYTRNVGAAANELRRRRWRIRQAV